MPRSGYTLPVFACAAALAALHWLRYQQPLATVAVDLLEPAQIAEIPVEQVAGLSESMALAVTRSEPGDNLDLTKNTPVWALVEWEEQTQEDAENILIRGGEGIGKRVNFDNQAAIYAYARRLLHENLQRMLTPGKKIKVTLILPEGRSLAARTSNAAFGVVEGLSLLGTTGISQPLSAPEQLEQFSQQLQQQSKIFDCLVFCVGENGLDLARQIGINPKQLVKTANWLGPMLVTAALYGVKEILLFGYHGKLIKLAGGIFHTHHYLADGRREILVAHCANLGLAMPDIQALFHIATAEAALSYLRALDVANGKDWVNQVYSAIAQEIDHRSHEYMKNHIPESMVTPDVGSVLFDRDRQIIVKSQTADTLITKLC